MSERFKSPADEYRNFTPNQRRLKALEILERYNQEFDPAGRSTKDEGWMTLNNLHSDLLYALHTYEEHQQDDPYAYPENQTLGSGRLLRKGITKPQKPKGGD